MKFTVPETLAESAAEKWLALGSSSMSNPLLQLILDRMWGPLGVFASSLNLNLATQTLTEWDRPRLRAPAFDKTLFSAKGASIRAAFQPLLDLDGYVQLKIDEFGIFAITGNRVPSTFLPTFHALDLEAINAITAEIREASYTYAMRSFERTLTCAPEDEVHLFLAEPVIYCQRCWQAFVAGSLA